jgi:hypothetical protein
VAERNQVTPREAERNVRRVPPTQPAPQPSYRPPAIATHRTPLQQRGNLTPQERPPDGSLVYWGTTGPDPRVPLYLRNPGGPKYENARDAKLRYAFLTNSEYNRLAKTMDKHYGPGRWKDDWVRNFWGRSVDVAEYALRSQGMLMTPFDAFDNLLSQTGGRYGSGGGGGGGRGGGGGTRTSIDRQEFVDLTNPMGARAFLEGAMQDYLGRRPDSAEYKNFLTALNSAERASPQVTTSRGTTSVSGSTQVSSSSAERSGGVVPQQFAREFARAQEGAAETSVSTTGINAFLELLGR